MSQTKFEYSVAIRTVGKAGDKYIKELESLHRQTVKPKHIYVHLAEGFDRPQTQVGMEEYIVTPKGLVHQRACSADGVDTEFLLILDDDIYFPDDGVERLYDELRQHRADCIAPDTFPSQNLSWKGQMIAYWANGVTSRDNDGVAIKITPNGAFSFNKSPEQRAVYPTESFPGTACLVKTEIFRSICYADEYWVDEFPPGTFFEDQLMSYKLHKNGFRCLLAYDTGILHLDAGTNKVAEKSFEKLMYRAMAQYVIWHRCHDGTPCFQDQQAWKWRYLRGLWLRYALSACMISLKFVNAYKKGVEMGKAFVKSETYLALPSFTIRNIIAPDFR